MTHPDGCPVRADFRALEDRDPYPVYAEARRSGPVFWDDTMHALVLLGYRECHEVLSDQDAFPMAWSRLEGGEAALGRYGIFNLTGDAHRQAHDLFLEHFNPRTNPTLRPTVQRLVDLVFDRALAKPKWEFGADIADIVPGLMALNFLGLPEDETLLETLHHANSALQRYVQSNGDDAGAFDELEQAKGQLRPLFLSVVEARRHQPADDVISVLLAQSAGRPDWDDNEMVSQCLFFFGASYGNTANVLTNMVYTLLTDPELRAWLADDDGDAIGAFVDEVMRVWPSVQFRVRIAARDCELAGVPVPAGTRILPVVAAANRDADRYPEPESVDLGRRGIRRHLAFGVGARDCVGATLARLEAEIVIRAFLARSGEIRLVSDPGQARFCGFNYRTFRPLVFEGRSGR